MEGWGFGRNESPTSPHRRGQAICTASPQTSPDFVSPRKEGLPRILDSSIPSNESPMLSFVHSQNFQFLTGIAIGSVWVFHGLYSKILSVVANCWDAGAKEVFIQVPSAADYKQATSQIIVRDTGHGMSLDEVQQAYLVLGRNRRKVGGEEVELALDFRNGEPTQDSVADVTSLPKKRRVMGRKGIGKLAGFGLAQQMTVTTWKGKSGVEFYLNLRELKLDDNASENVPIKWKWITPKPDHGQSGTIVSMQILKHKTAIDVSKLRMSLARRFSRTVTGEMTIKVNGFELPDPTPDLDLREPPKDEGKPEMVEEKLTDGNVVRYWYGFATKLIHERELRGFTILVNGKVAQAPPFFFDVEATASGQHSTKYVIGGIEADFIDIGTDDESDLVSTDRQEIDWEAEKVEALRTWGQKLARKVLSDCAEFRGKKTKDEVLKDPDLAKRIARLDRGSQKEINRFLGILGNRDEDKDRTLELAGSLVRAYEFRQFHDVIEDIEKAANDPNRLAEMLRQLSDWKVLESRAILEIVKGRLEILDKFEKMLCNDAPETASAKNPENMHDLLAANPWLLNPEWQVLAEEKAITTQLREWGLRDLPDYKGRYDFLALGGDGLLVIIEIKRPEHPAEHDEMTRLTTYQNNLALAHGRPIKMVFICGRDPKISKQALEAFETNPYYEIRYWNQVFGRTRSVYEHYRAVLEGSVNDPAFKAKEEEVLQTRELLKHGIHRGPEAREQGIPSQDVNYVQALPPPPSSAK